MSDGRGECEPTNADILAYLEKINGHLGNVERSLGSLTVLEKEVEGLEKKVDGFNLELKKIWVAMEERNKSLDIRVTGVEEKIECVDLNRSEFSSKVIQYEKEKDSLNEDVLYLTSQCMLNNLIFTNVDEIPQEDSQKTEHILKNHLEQKLKIASDLVKDMRHRIGEKGVINQGILLQVCFVQRQRICTEAMVTVRGK